MTVATVGSVPTSASGSKPHAINALRTTWRRSTEHFVEQVGRFVRLLVISAIPVVVSAVTAATVNGQHFDPKTLLALLVPVAEVAYRQVFPALGAAAADSAPGVTIVPTQVGVPDAPSADPNVTGILPVAPPSPGVDTTPTGDGPPVAVGDAAP